MRELLIQLQREVEVCRRACRPPAGDRRARLTVEGAVHLDRIEVFGVETQLVEMVGSGALRTCLRVKQPVPGPFSRWVVPARSADTYVAHPLRSEEHTSEL